MFKIINMSTENADKMLDDGKGVPATTIPAPTTVVTNEPAPTTVTAIPPTTVVTNEPAPTTVAAMTTLSREELEAHLRSSGFLGEGESIDSFKKPPTEDEEKKVAKQKKDSAFKYALENGSIEKEQYDGYILDSARPVDDIAFDSFSEQFLADLVGTEEEGSYNADDVRDLFNKRAYSTKEKGKLANVYLQEKYGILHGDNIVNDYDLHQTSLQKATAYKGIVDSAISMVEAGSIKIIVDDVEVEYKPSKEVIGAVRNVYTDPKAFSIFGDQSNANTMAEAMKTNVIMNDLQRFVAEVSQSYHSKMVEKLQLGRRGVDGGIYRGFDSGAGGAGGKASTKTADGMIEQAKKQ